MVPRFHSWSDRATVLLPAGALGLYLIGQPYAADAVMIAVYLLWLRHLAGNLKAARTSPAALSSNERRVSLADVLAVSLLFAVATIAIRQFFVPEPLLYWDYYGLGADWLEGFHVWSWRGLGRPSPPDTYALVFYPLAVLNRALATNLVLWLPPYLMVISMYVLARGVGLRSLSAVAAALLYLMNPAVHTRYLQAHTGMLLGYGTLPLVMLHGLQLASAAEWRGRIHHAIWLAFFAALTAIHQLHFLPLIAILCLGILVAVRASDASSYRFRPTFALMVLAGTMTAGLLASQLLALSTIVQPSTAIHVGSPGHVRALSVNAMMLNLVRLIGEPAAGMMTRMGYYEPSVGTALAFGLPLVVGRVLVNPTQGRLFAVNALGVVLVLGLLLATGATYVPGPYQWAVDNVPLFALFRESSKFLSLAALTMPLLAAFGLETVLDRLRRKSFDTWVAVSGVLAALASGWLMAAGRGDFGVLSTHRIPVISQGFRDAGRWIDSRSGTFRVLVLPYDDVTLRTWPQVSRRPAVGLDLPAYLYTPPRTYRALVSLFGALYGINPRPLGDTLAAAGIDYIVAVDRPPEDPALFTSPLARIPFEEARTIAHTAGFREVRRLPGIVIYEAPARHGLVQSYRTGSPGPPPRSSVPREGCQALSDQRFSRLPATPLKRPPWQDIAVGYAGRQVRTVDPSEVDQQLHEAWISSDAFEYVRGGLYWGGDETLGERYAVTESGAILTIPVAIQVSGSYILWLRYATGTPKTTLQVQTGPSAFRLRGTPDFQLQWHSAGEVGLVPGRTSVQIRAAGGLAAVDAVALIRSDVRQVPPEPCGDSLTRIPAPASVEIVGASPTFLQLRLPPHRQWVGVSQAYHPGWSATGERGSLRIATADGFAWAAYSDGSEEIRMVFVPQSPMRGLIRLQILLAVLVSVVGMLLLSRRAR